MPDPHVTARPFIRWERSGTAKWKAKWSVRGEQRFRTLGPAWVESAGEGWRPRRGRPAPGYLTEHQAIARLQALVGEHDRELDERERAAQDRVQRGVTFRELAREWLAYLAHEKGAKPSTLADYHSMLAEPGQPHRRGPGKAEGILLREFGDRLAIRISVRDVAEYLRRIERDGCKPRLVNKHRQVIHAMYAYGQRDDTHALPLNPAAGTTKRREPPPSALEFYEPEDIEALARAAASGLHRRSETHSATALVHHQSSAREVTISPEECAARHVEDVQDAELFRVLAYTGIRLGELVVLRWSDVDFAVGQLVIHRALSGGQETTTKVHRVRYVPLSTAAAQALARLSRRSDFTGRDEYVFCNRLGRRLDSSAIRRRFKAAAAAAGLRSLKLHDLRHGAGSLVAREADAVFVQAFLGHARITTTQRYMHAKARPEDVARLDRAFRGAAVDALSADREGASM
jgi:integrase